MNASSLRTAKWGGFALLLVVYLVVVPTIYAESRYILRIVSTSAVLSVISLGVWLTFAIGRINIGQAAFALIGGYTVAIATTSYGLSFWLALPLSGIMSALVGIVLGVGILRLKGVYFAMITLSLTEAMRLVFHNGGDFTGGATGISRIPVPNELSIFGLVLIPDFSTVNTHLAFYFLSASLLLFTFACVWRISTSRLGWIFRSLQQDEDLATSIGINVAKYRVMAYALCCFFGGLGGAYFTVAQQSVYPSVFGIPDSIFFILYCFLGGLTYVWGPIVGAFLLFLTFEYLHALQQYQQLIYASIMIGIMLWLPNGLLSLAIPERFRRAEPLAEPADEARAGRGA